MSTLANPRSPRPDDEAIVASTSSRAWRRWLLIRDAAPAVMGTWLLAVGVFCVATALIPPLREATLGLRTIIELLTIGAQPNLAYGALLLLLGSGALRRKRAAWWLLVPLTLVSALANVVPPAVTQFLLVDELAGRAINAALMSIVLLLLLAAHPAFSAPPPHGAVRHAALAYLATSMSGFAIGLVLVAISPGSIAPEDRALLVAINVFGGFANPGDVGVPGDAPPHVDTALGLLGALGVIAVAAVLLRAGRQPATLSVDDETTLRGLLAVHGDRDSLGYFATRRDRCVVFSPNRQASVGYRVINGVCLAAGNPAGDPRSWSAAITVWQAEAAQFGWVTAVLGADEFGAAAYLGAGLSALELGDEAVLEVDQFSLDGPAMSAVRQGVARAERTGAVVSVQRHAELLDVELDAVISAADRWRETRTERGFSMALGRLGDRVDAAAVLVRASDGDGQLRALLSLVPWGADGLSLDVMRRDPLADNGLVELMVSALIQTCPELGIKRISLNFAVFRGLLEDGARLGAGPIARATRGLLLVASRFWQIDSLYRSNSKYQPRWVPRYLCYDSARSLAAVLVAGARAEGFLPSPGSRRGRGPSHGSRRSWRRSRQTIAAASWQHQRAGQLEPRVVKLAAALAASELPPAVAAPTPAQQGSDRYEQLHEVLGAAGAYPLGLAPSLDCASAVELAAHLEQGTLSAVELSVAGRVMARRDHGGVLFLDLRDSGGTVQVIAERDVLGLDVQRGLAALRATLRVGDVVVITGFPHRSRSGQPSVTARSWRLAAPHLGPHLEPNRPAGKPQRHVSMALDLGGMVAVQARAAVSRAIRQELWQQGYLEVETPMLHPVKGGAAARPFLTRANVGNQPLSLRIAPELYLKRLLVGGVPRLFELGRSFRNEGVDATHNPEFTSLEAYRAWSDYTGMAELAQQLVVCAARQTLGGTVLRRSTAGPALANQGEGAEVDLTAPWPRRSVLAALSGHLGELIEPTTPVSVLARAATAHGLDIEPEWGRLVEELYSSLLEPSTVGPTFWCDFPVSTSPLTRAHRVHPELAERWDLVAFGIELGTGYTELNDPREQRARLTAQALRAAGGDAEAMELDEDFLAALEFGMPPAGGLGIGIDRLLMLLTGRSIRDVVLFPTARGRGRR